MGYFDTVHNRKQTKSAKWDNLQAVFGADDLVPLWVADMDFQAPQPALDALCKRAQHGIFGYTLTDEPVQEAILQWVRKRHDWNFPATWLSFSPGVVTSMHMAIQALTNPGDAILIQTPVYPPFFHTVRSHDRKLVESQLIEEDGKYEIDFADFEAKLKSGVKAFLLCSPHNPVGRVWKREELAKMAALCVAYDVLILSDEIHCDLIYPGHKHIPIASLSDKVSKQTVTFMSPSKTFNLAGLQASYMVTENESLRRKLDHMLTIQGHKQLNTMGITAMEAVYRHGEPWLNELITVLENNYKFVTNTFAKELPELRVIQPEGTYLLWVDCTALGLNSSELQKFMIEQARVGLNAGVDYGNGGETFMRINLACPPATLTEGIERIVKAVYKADLLHK